jgi:YHS domain-containing protein
MKQILLLLLSWSFTSSISFAQKSLVQNRKDDKVILHGYDAVAYIKEAKAVKGSKTFSVLYNDAVYYFSSAANKELFKKSPNSYVPQYGGWCAYAMGKDGSFVDIDPETFKVTDGKLYLFYNRLLTNTLKYWNKDEVKLKKQAEVNWAKLSN